MRLTITLTAFLVVSQLAPGGLARGEDEEAGKKPPARPTFKKLMEDPATAKFMTEGVKRAKKYFQEEAELAAMKRGSSESKVAEERADWREWMDESKEAIGIDLYRHPRIVIDTLEEGQAQVLNRMVKLKKGSLDYGSKDAPGYSRGNIAYTVLVPKDYAPHKIEEGLPLVVTMHGRAINLRHPALKKSPEERSRIVVWNNWMSEKKKPLHDVVVIAPTGRPEGFSFEKAPDFARQTVFLALGVGHTDYRTDELKTFVEVYGDMIQVASQYSNLCAGIIWRDREDQQAVPVSEDETMVFDNLNGRPLYYVADKKMWDKIGKPMEAALKAAYERAGKPDNLIIEQVERDANGALRADPEKMKKFLEARIPMPQREFKWLYWSPALVGPMPILLTRADYSYDATEKIKAMPLRDRCGSIEFKATIEMAKVPDGKPAEGEEQKYKDAPINLIDLKITEAQAAKIFLYEPLVDLDLPVTVKVNGNVVLENEMVKRDWKLFERYCMPRRFFTFPVVGEIDVEFPVVPRVKPEPIKEGEGEGDAPAEGDGAEKSDDTASKGAPQK